MAESGGFAVVFEAEAEGVGGAGGVAFFEGEPAFGEVGSFGFGVFLAGDLEVVGDDFLGVGPGGECGLAESGPVGGGALGGGFGFGGGVDGVEGFAGEVDLTEVGGELVALEEEAEVAGEGGEHGGGGVEGVLEAAEGAEGVEVDEAPFDGFEAAVFGHFADADAEFVVAAVEDLDEGAEVALLEELVEVEGLGLGWEREDEQGREGEASEETCVGRRHGESEAGSVGVGKWGAL